MTILNEAHFKQNWSCSECKQWERKWKQLCRNDLNKKSLNPKKSGQHKQLQLDTHLILSESSPLRCGLLVTRMRNVPSGQASSCFWAVRRSMSPTYLVDRDNSHNIPGGQGQFSHNIPGGQGQFSHNIPGGQGQFSHNIPGGQGQFS